MSTPGGRVLPRPLTGRRRVPGDKAISHRAAILAALAAGTSRIVGFSPAGDCRASLRLVESLGCRARSRDSGLELTGLGAEPQGQVFEGPLDCDRSGTTMRLGAGLLAGLPFTAVISGHAQLLARPMERVAKPLREMGAEVETAPGGLPPIRIRGGALRGIEYRPPQASAQVKSAVLIAAIRAGSPTTVLEPVPTRDHTERMLVAMGARLETEELPTGRSVRLEPGPIGPLELRVPGDASSAAVLAAAAALVPGSELVLEGVSINPGRTGFLRALERMGGSVLIEPLADSGPEPSADIRIRQAPLGAIRIDADEVPALIDELPLLGLLATSAEGTTEVHGAAELRVKESDRIAGLVAGLRALGAAIEEVEDGFVVQGPTVLRGGGCDSLTDHRLAMTFTLAGLVSQGPVEVSGSEFISDSFPGFLECLGGPS